MRALVLPLAATAMLVAGPADAALRERDGRLCHDMVVIGEVKAYGAFLGYHEMDPDPDPDAIYIGGRYDLTVRIEEVINGRLGPRDITVRALMGSAYRLPRTMLFYLQKEERGSYWAVDWAVFDERGRVETPDDPSPRCQS
jgi:hypothetical protein